MANTAWARDPVGRGSYTAPSLQGIIEEPTPEPTPKPASQTARQKLISGSIGDDPQQYRGVVREVYQQMTPGQAGEVEFMNQANAGQVSNMTTGLANNFIDRYMEKNNGALPTEAQVNDFVAKNMTTGNAKRMLTGQMPDATIKAELVDPHLNTITPPSTDMGATAPDTGLAKRMDDLYAQALGYGERKIDERYIPLKQKMVDEEAALGRLRSPSSIVPLSGLEESRQGEKSDLYAQMAGNRIGNEMGLAQQLADIGSREKIAGNQLGLQKWQTGLSSDLANRTLSEQLNQYNQEQGLKRREMGVAENYLKNLGDNKKRDWADWTTFALKGLETGANIYSTIKGAGKNKQQTNPNLSGG